MREVCSTRVRLFDLFLMYVPHIHQSLFVFRSCAVTPTLQVWYFTQWAASAACPATLLLQTGSLHQSLFQARPHNQRQSLNRCQSTSESNVGKAKPVVVDGQMFVQQPSVNLQRGQQTLRNCSIGLHPQLIPSWG